MRDKKKTLKSKEFANLYQGIRNVRLFYKNREGEVIADDDEVLTRWRDYFNDLLNEQDKNGNKEYQGVEIQSNPADEEALSLTEVTENIVWVKTNKGHCSGMKENGIPTVIQIDAENLNKREDAMRWK